MKKIVTKDQCFKLGTIIRTYRNDGEVVAKLDVDDCDIYSDIEYLFLEIDHNNGLVPFAVSKFVTRHNNEVVVQLTDIDNIDEAKQLKGASIYLPEEHLPELSTSQFYYHEIVGWDVEDTLAGKIGKIDEIIDNPTNPLFSILTDEKKEVLIPIQQTFIKCIDKERKRIIVTCPEGLIQLYLEE